jgi:hypothetical protein
VNFAKKDLIHNVQKIEVGVHSWMSFRERNCSVEVELANGRQVSTAAAIVSKWS